MRNAGRALVSRRRLIRNGLLMAASSACGPWAFGRATDRGDHPGSGSAIASWRIGNGLIARTVTFHAGSGLFTEQLSDLSTHVDFILPGKIRANLAQEFSFLCNGQICAGNNASFNLVDGSETALANGKSLAVNLRHKTLALEVSVVYCVYEGHAAIRKHLVLRNTGTTALHLSHLDIESIAVTLGPENETTLLTQYGTIPREIFYPGALKMPACCWPMAAPAPAWPFSARSPDI